jgi:5'-3' exoribonuclease 2
MLGLSTHDPHFYIIRERLESQEPRNNAPKGDDIVLGEENTKTIAPPNASNFIINFTFVKLFVVREYLNATMQEVQLPFAYNLENVIDDFVLMCFLVGNDFLPHLPGLDIRMGGIDLLLAFYKKTLPKLKGFLTNECEVDLVNLEIFFRDLSRCEYDLLRKIEDVQYNNVQRSKQFAEMQIKTQEEIHKRNNGMNANELGNSETTLGKRDHPDGFDPLMDSPEAEKNGDDEIDKEDILPLKIAPSEMNRKAIEELFNHELTKELHENTKDEMFDFEFIFDQSQNYKQSYYQKKFMIDKYDYESLISCVKRYYIEGIVWNFNYYYKGCCSWNWFYPFYYAPLLSDICNFSSQNITFDLAQPFKPLEQLLAVLPPYSSHALPRALQPLMLEEESPIYDFYPDDFQVDLVGKRFAWLGEIILPFVQDDRLKSAILSKVSKLTQNEQIRNSPGYNVLFYCIDSTAPLFGNMDEVEPGAIFSLKQFSENLRWDKAKVRVFSYSPPEYGKHICKPLRGVKMPKGQFYYAVS